MAQNSIDQAPNKSFSDQKTLNLIAKIGLICGVIALCASLITWLPFDASGIFFLGSIILGSGALIMSLVILILSTIKHFGSIAIRAGFGLGTGGLALAYHIYKFLTAFKGGFGHGRLFRIQGKKQTAPFHRDATWNKDQFGMVHLCSEEQKQVIGQYWLAAATEEHASIAAFSVLSLRLMCLGAPPQLLEWAHQAAKEEIEHAQFAYSVASNYLGYPCSPGEWPAINEVQLDSLFVTMAVESWVDGCLGEGTAHLMMKYASESVEDLLISKQLAKIAQEELSHAELAWAILSWTLKQGGEPVRQSLYQMIHQSEKTRLSASPTKSTELSSKQSAFDPSLELYGLVSPILIKQFREKNWQESIQRLSSFLQVGFVSDSSLGLTKG